METVEMMNGNQKECGCCGSGHSHSHIHNHSHEHSAEGWSKWLAPAFSFIMLITGIILTHIGSPIMIEDVWISLAWYILAFLPVGLPVVREAFETILKGDIFNEFTLMTVACVGAFCIREFPEAVGVMLFYSVGESLQDIAVNKARKNISRLIDLRSDKARLIVDEREIYSDPKSVKIGSLIEVRPGERVPLDGVLETEAGVFDTSALTGESIPRTMVKGDQILAGMLSSNYTIRIRVTKEYGKSTLSRILELVTEAAGRKASSELFIRRFARVYTPIVMGLAVLIVMVPWIVGLAHPSFRFIFTEWFYRALVFLVISCPCALVISVPLGYFAGIGAASKSGILFKGGNFLDIISKIDTVAFDKTGTLTTGTFSVEKIEIIPEVKKEVLLKFMAAAEINSTHPLAKALFSHIKGMGISVPTPSEMQEIPGFGTKAIVEGHDVVVGSVRLLLKEGISFPEFLHKERGTIIVCAIDRQYAGFVVMADTLKNDASVAIGSLRELGIGHLVMLSGDSVPIVEDFADRLDIPEAYGGLLPQDKAEYVEKVSKTPGRKIAFVGDGMNDAPVLALSNVGIAMGGLGSDAAIESADVVVQTDGPSKVATAIKIGRATHAIVLENIVGAIGIKVAILILGAFGIASLWAAVFADVGVALMAVLNSVRIMWKRF